MSRARTFALLSLVALIGGCSKMDAANNTSTESDEVSSDLGNRGEMIFCKEVQQRTTVSDCDDLTLTAKASEEGTAAFNVPPMVRGTETILQLAISFRRPPEEADPATYKNGTDAGPSENAASSMGTGNEAPTPLPSPSPRPTRKPRPEPNPADVVKNLPGAGPPETYYPVVGRHMRATLVGQGFKIEAVDDPSQDLSPGSVTTWTWKVTPLRSSVYTLTIKTVVEGEMANGKRVPLGSTSENKSVQVTVRWYHRLWDGLTEAPAWIKLLTGLLVALGALAGAWWKFFRAVKGEGEDGGEAKDAKKESPPVDPAKDADKPTGGESGDG